MIIDGLCCLSDFLCILEEESLVCELTFLDERISMADEMDTSRLNQRCVHRGQTSYVRLVRLVGLQSRRIHALHSRQYSDGTKHTSDHTS